MSDTVTLSDGTVIMDVPTADAFSIDAEAAAFVLMDMDYLIDRYHNTQYRTTAGYLHYLSLGTLQLSKGQRAKTDEILRRTAFRERHGLTGPGVELGSLLEQSISEAEFHVIQALRTQESMSSRTQGLPTTEQLVLF